MLDLLDGSLCTKCSAIDLESFLSVKHDCQTNRPKPRKYLCSVDGRNNRISMGPLHTWSIDTCSLCALLSAAIIPTDIREDIANKYYLVTACSHQPISDQQPRQTLGMMETMPPKIMLLIESDYIPDFLIVQAENCEDILSLQTDSIDFSILQKWVDFCKDNHTEKCAMQHPKHVQHLKLIDCDTRQIVAASGARYVTLSYVWGPNTEIHVFSDVLPTDLPLTIQDAITVTQNLGFRYLWVDRYCINQQDKETVISQIDYMGSIYNNSSLTIVAACGKDPSFGLPGVSTRQRRPQAQGKIGPYHLLSPWHRTNLIIQFSLWASRGWTYQEALLSRRRLIFTEEQVYFECYGMFGSEACNPILDYLHTEDRQSFQKKYCTFIGDKVGIFPAGVGTKDLEILHRITEYSRKSFTHQSDRLKGFLGILAAFEAQGVYHWWGVPVLPASPSFMINSNMEPADLASAASSATSLGLCWEEPTGNPECIRIGGHGLPSWSWAAWTGPMDIGGDSDELEHPNAQVNFELLDGSSLDWFHLRKQYSDIRQNNLASPFIHISGDTMNPTNLSQTSRNCKCEFEMKDGYFVEYLFETSASILHQREDLKFVMLGTRVVSYKYSRVFVVILSNVGQWMERIQGCWWWSFDVVLYDEDHNPVYNGIFKEDPPTDEEYPKGRKKTRLECGARYGKKHWYKELKTTWETHRVG